MAPKVPFLKYDTHLRQAAARFLAKHHADGSLPVPIEEIIEFDFKMDIVPMPGMHKAFDVDSFISHDLNEIRSRRRNIVSLNGRQIHWLA